MVKLRPMGGDWSGSQVVFGGGWKTIRYCSHFISLISFSPVFGWHREWQLAIGY